MNPHDPTSDAELGAAILERLLGRNETVASAESLTGGALGAALSATPGSAQVYRGGVIVYATDLKNAYLNVDAALLRQHGPVHPDVAIQMAEGVRASASATWGVATTGVAGPGDSEDGPEGLVYVGIAGPSGSEAVELRLGSGRDRVRAESVTAALRLLLRHLT